MSKHEERGERAREAMARAVPYTLEGYPGGEVCALLRAVLEAKV